jgi:AcrR family transcriptional regulator
VPAATATKAGTWLLSGRVEQKRRTRAAVVAAAAELLTAGRTPTVAEAAEAAGVSRATAYRYFRSQDELLTEAAIERTIPAPEQVVARAHPSSPEARLDLVVRTYQQMVAANETPFRAMLRFSLDRSAEETDGPAERGADSVRTGRRLHWIDEALEPVRGDLDRRTYRRLANALAALMGVEALVVLRDVCGLSSAEAVRVTRWAAQALLREALSGRRP